VVGIAGAVVLFCALALGSALLVYRFATDLFDVGLPTMLASMSVGPRVPDWVGHADRDDVVRLDVPRGISTLSVRGVSDQTRDAAIAHAYAEAREQLDDLFPDNPAPAEPHFQPPTQAATEASASTPTKEWALRAAYALFVYVVLTGFAFLVPLLFQEVAVGGIGPWLVALLAVGLIVALVVATFYFGGVLRARRLAAGRPVGPLKTLAWLVPLILALVVLVNFDLGTGFATGDISRFGHVESVAARVVAKKRESALSWYYKAELTRPVRDTRAGTLWDYCDTATPQGHRCLVFYTSLGGVFGMNIPRNEDVIVVKATRETYLGKSDIWAGSDISAESLGIAAYVWFAVVIAWGLFDLGVWLRERLR
jgi:hypothetical protein